MQWLKKTLKLGSPLHQSIQFGFEFPISHEVVALDFEYLSHIPHFFKLWKCVKYSQWNINLALTWSWCSLCDSLLMWCMSQGRGPCHYSRRGGREEKRAVLIPRAAVLLWDHDQAVFVFTVGSQSGKGRLFVYLCVCVCVCSVLGVALQTCWDRDRVENDGWCPCLIWSEEACHVFSLKIPLY